jgi:glycine/D-amino acid oxidase-like deaminating enzyme
LKSLGVAAAAAAAHACARPVPSLAPEAQRRFAPVNVDWDRITRTTVGLRPFRPSGFLLRGEKFGDKLVVHNYGHGGGGITVSWGTAALAWEEAHRSEHRRAAVVGCGVIGLSTARLLQRRGWDVTIYARDLPPQTTSNMAAGQWSPASIFDTRSPEFTPQFDRALRLSHRMFQDYIGTDYGVHWLENYVCQDREFGAGLQGASTNTADLYFESEELDPRQHPFPRKYVRRFTTMMIEPPIYLNALLRDYQLAGGRIVPRELASRDAMLALEAPVIMNCTGLGAKPLFGDEELTPVKGQLTVLLPQAEIDYIVLADNLYMMPRRDGILLGGTHERGEWSLDVNKAAMEEVVRGHLQFYDGMRRAKHGGLVIRPGLVARPVPSDAPSLTRPR